MRWLICFLLTLGLAAGGGAASADTTPYRQYETHDGLPSQQITTLTQTKNGLLWIGTKHGLVVYDGQSFRPIPMPDSVRQKNVLALEPMPDGTVWAGVGSDAVRVAPHGVVQSHLLDSHHVVEILRRGDRIQIVTHLAVWKQAANCDSLSRTRLRYEKLKDVTQVDGADLGPQGTLWIVNGNRGPGRVQPNGRVDFAPSILTKKHPDEPFYDLRFSEDGTALVVRGSGLYRFNPEAKSFTKVADTLAVNSDIHRRGRTAYLTRGATVLRYDTQARRFREPVGATKEFPNATTTEALRGREGGLWVGTQQAGLLHFPAPEARHVKSIDGHTIRTGMGFRRKGGTLWGSTWGDGLFQLRPQRKHVIPDGHTRWVMPASHDGYLHGLTPTKTAPRGRKWYRWSPSEGWQFVTHANPAVRGHVDSSGVGYFWHNQGLYRHVPSGDTTRATRLRTWPLGESQHHLMGAAPNGDIILFDQGDVLRLRRPDGAVIDTIATVPEHAESAGRGLAVDQEGRMWAPFSSLLRVDLQGGTARTMLRKAGIQNVVMAGDSLAMVQSDEGLYLLDSKTGIVRRHLTKADGLLSNDVNGSLLMEDTLYVGHLSGLTLFPSDSLFRTPPTPHALLTGLEVNLSDRALPADSLLAQGERAVGFSYTAASLTHPDRVRFEERLVPRDTAWTATGRRFTRYTNLAPGTYRFEVRARLTGQSPGPVTTYTFTIPPHFYETSWFQLLIGVGLLGLVLGGYRWRTLWLRRRKRELETAVEKRTRALAEAKEKTEEQAEKLAELDEAKNRFFAHISHEFRTPLSLILSPLREGLRKRQRLRLEQMRRMEENAGRLRRLIDQLLDLATLEADQMGLDRQPGDLAATVERSAAAFRSKAEEKEIDLRVDTPEGRIETRFDPEKVETIVSNLVGNAVKFTPEAGRVTVRVEETASTAVVEEPTGDEDAVGTVRIEVADTGPGIDPSTQEAIFDRFEQADNSMTRAHEGTGLGLALTHELVELHGGVIDVDSAPGDGSTFTVRLPRVPVARGQWENGDEGDRALAEVGEPEDARKSGRARAVAGDGARSEVESTETGADEEATILVVEDNLEMRTYLREELGRTWTVRGAADGETGWQKVQDEAPDLVVSDVMMPEVDGFELCRRIKEDPELRTIPVLLLTARADEGATREGLQSGADDYVEKPFDPEELRRRIDNHLAARRHLRARYQDEVRLASVDVAADEEDLPFIERVVEAIEAHIGNPDLTIAQLADEMALSRRQFSRRLKDAAGESPSDFLRRCRIERAKTLFEEGAETVSEVAYAVGYRSPSHFSQVFQEVVGTTPSTYREKGDG